MSASRTIVINGLIIALTTAFALLVLEVAVRAFHLAPLSEPKQDGAGLKPILRFDSVLETRYQPGSTTRIISPYGEFDINYSINQLGLRNSEIRPKSSAEFRILVAGNSFVEGWGVAETDSFVRVAERAANDSLAAAGRLRFINAGISAYGAAQSYLQVKKVWDMIDPDMVILVVVGTMVNSDYKFLKQAGLDANKIAVGLSADAVLAGGTTEANQPKAIPAFLLKLANFSAIARMITERLENRNAMERIRVGDPETDMLAAYRSDDELLARMYEPTLRHANALADLSSSRGKPFLLVHLPMAFQVSSTAWSEGRKAYRLEPGIQESRETEIVKSFCEAKKLHCAFADDIVKAEPQAANGSSLYYRYDFHFAPYGNHFIGTWLSQNLDYDFIRKKLAVWQRANP